MIIIRFRAFLLICKRNSQSNFKFLHFLTCCAPSGGGGVLQILSDGDDRRIFLGLKCLTAAFLGGRGGGKRLG